MEVQPLAIQLAPLFIDDQHRVELIGRDLVQADVDAQVQGRAQVQSAPDEQASFGGLGGIESIERTVTATAALGRFRAQTGIAQFVAPERPMDEVTQGGLFRPLPG